MSLPEGDFEIGPKTGRLLIRTGREGIAAVVGHDLTITFARWAARVVLAGTDVAAASVEATLETNSITILEGSGGALPLTAHDRAEIKKTALRLLEAATYPTATYASTAIERDGDGAVIDGELTVRGQSTPVRITVVVDGDCWRGAASVLQSRVGIEPYRALFGALRLADAVLIEIEVSLPVVGR